jgi:hypothetical protein
MLGPVFGGWGFALALNINFVAMPFWVIMVLAGLAALLSLAVYEGDGHEIKLEGDEEVESEKPMVERRDVEVGLGIASKRENAGIGGASTP